VDPSRWIVLDPPKLDTLPSNFRPVRTGGIYAVVGSSFWFLFLIFRLRKAKNVASQDMKVV